MSSAAILGLGTLFQRSTDGTTYTTIAEVGDIGDFGGDRDKVDATTQDSTIEEFTAGINKYGDVSFPIKWIPTNATQSVLESDQTTGTTRYWRIVANDAVKSWRAFQGFVVSFKMSHPVKDHNSATVVICVNTTPTSGVGV